MKAVLLINHGAAEKIDDASLWIRLRQPKRRERGGGHRA